MSSMGHTPNTRDVTKDDYTSSTSQIDLLDYQNTRRHSRAVPEAEGDPHSFHEKGLFMFKWLCLATAVVAAVVFGWMLNNIRLDIKRTRQLVNQHLPPILENTDRAVKVANERLPEILEQTTQVTKTIQEHLPETLKRVDEVTEVASDLSGDIKQLKELWAGLNADKRDKTLL